MFYQLWINSYINEINIIKVSQNLNMSRQVFSQYFLKTQDSQMRYTTNLPLSTLQLTKIIKTLQKLYQQQKQKRQQIETKLQNAQRRGLQRQSELINILKKLREDKSVISQQSPQIQKLFNKIWECFDEFSKKTVQIIEQKYEDNYKSMDRRVSVILQHFKIQLGKRQTNSFKNIQGIHKQIKLLCQTAIKIEEKNTQLLETLKKSEFQKKILSQEKFLILQDLNLKKNKISSLLQQIKTLKRLAQLKSPSNNQLHSSKIKKQENQTKEQATSRISVRNEQKNTCLIRISQPKTSQFQEFKKIIKGCSEAQPSASSTLDLFHNQRKFTLKNDKQMAKIGSTFSCTPKSHHNRSYTSHTNRNKKNASQLIANNKKTKNNNQQIHKISLRVSSIYNYDDDNNHINPCIKKQNKKDVSTTNKQMKIVECPECKNKVPIPQIQQETSKQQNYIKSIQSLQRCLKRQKQKNMNLGGIVTRISNKSQQVNQALQKIILDIQNQSLTNNSIEPAQKLDSILQSEKLFNMIKVLQQRLSMLQKPTVSCGWGDSWGEDVVTDL